jgi:hypothetical protein
MYSANYFLVAGSPYLLFGIRHQASAQASGIRYQASGIRHQASASPILPFTLKLREPQGGHFTKNQLIYYKEENVDKISELSPPSVVPVGRNA